MYYQEKEKEIEVQKEKIKQLRQEEDERKKKFVLVKNKYEQELRETQEIQEIHKTNTFIIEYY